MGRRAVVLAFGGRFVDELVYGAIDVLLPTLKRVFGLSLIQVGLLSQVISWVALVVEPPAAGLVDLRSRRWLMAAGAGFVALGTLALGAAPGFGFLLAAFALYGIGSGPLVNTADVVVIESFPEAPARAFSRATFVDTLGALLGPASVAVATAAGVSWRLTLALLGGATLAYALALARTPQPGPPSPHGPGTGVQGVLSLATTLVANVGQVLRDAAARRALVVLACFDVFEAAFVLKYVWLHDEVGLSGAWVAAYAAGEHAVDLAALVLLDRWLAHRDPGRVLRAAALALIALPAVWVGAPGVAGRVAVGIPLAVAYAVVWPLAKSQALTAVPRLAGATQAVTTLFPVVPLVLLQAWLSSAVGMGPALVLTATGAAVLMALATRQPVSTGVEGSGPAGPGRYASEHPYSSSDEE